VSRRVRTSWTWPLWLIASRSSTPASPPVRCSSSCNEVGLPALAVKDIRVVEGNSGPAAATFTITRSGDTSGTSTVKYATATTETATPGSDYTAVPLVTITFASAETTKLATVNVTGDSVSEANEYFYLSLSVSTGATVSDTTGIATIVNDD